MFLLRCFCSLCFILRIILFGIPSPFTHNEASSLYFEFDQKIFLNDDFLSSLPSNRSKVDWKGKKIAESYDSSWYSCSIFGRFMTRFPPLVPKCIVSGKSGFSSQILNFALCGEIFRDRNCRDFRLCFISACFSTCFLKLTAAFFQPVCRLNFFAW